MPGFFFWVFSPDGGDRKAARAALPRDLTNVQRIAGTDPVLEDDME